MITIPTLFVLGAGASIPYGFPSGLQLRKMICELANNASNETIQHLHSIGLSTTSIRSFATSFMQSKVNSIDSFLSRRTGLSEMGKLLIAAMLIPFEEDYRLDNLENDDDWYSTLWNALIQDVSVVSDLFKNKIQIITFNYDRSLERYFHTAIMETFKATPEEAFEALAFLNIQHVYGSLGKFGVSDDNDCVRAYHGNLSMSALDIAAANIKVIPESRSDAAIFDQAKAAYLTAEHVCFLGFGFDPLNVERLGFQKLNVSGNTEKLPIEIVASTFTRTEAEVDIFKRSTVGSMRPDGLGYYKVNWNHSNTKNLETLKNFAWLIY